jgi:hydrogenase expression/formation protein HypD
MPDQPSPLPLASQLQTLSRLAAGLGRPVTIMEVCGTHTMAAARAGLHALLPQNVSLLAGPGCPVCVTPIRYIDRAVAIALQPDTLVATFGDLVRVPGTSLSLEQARARGAAVEIVYSPSDALVLARQQPGRRVVFLGVGFETTAPAVAWTLRRARQEGLRNYSVLCAHKTMPQAMAALVRDGQVKIDGFLCPGHVSVITGAGIFSFLAEAYRLPCVVAGFEPADILEGLAMLLEQIRAGRPEVGIQYRRSVRLTGNVQALSLLQEVFAPADTEWRGLGLIPGSGLSIREDFAAWDADPVFASLPMPESREPDGCRCGDVLRGLCRPPDCPLFARACTPATPVGACMVSSEGACAAYHHYQGTPRALS